MKKIIAIAAAAAMLFAASEASAQVIVGAGYVNSTTTSKVSDNKASSDANGFYVGASYNIPLVGGLGLAPGLYYEFLGSSSKKDAGIFTASGTPTEHYLNIPVMVNYSFGLASDCSLFAFAGPTLEYGLASSTKLEASAGGISGEKTVNNYDADDYGRFDCLLGLGVGFNIRAFQVKVGYDFGMVNRYTGSSDKASLHRNQVHLGVAYVF